MYSCIAADAAARNISEDDYVARLEAQGAPHGTPSQVQEAIARLSELGVSRLYVQLVSPLGDIDLGRLGESFEILRG